MTGRRLLEWRQIRTIALGALAIALFGAAVLVVSVPGSFWDRGAGPIAADLSVIVAVFWFLLFTVYLIFAYSAAREVATVKAGYGIATAFENGVLRYELKFATHKPAANLLEECAQFLKDTFRVLERSISTDGTGLTANVAAFAFDIFPHGISIVISPRTDQGCSVSVATKTRLILGLPVVDTHGVAIIALFVGWAQGTPLQTSPLPWVMWKTVVSSARSRGTPGAASKLAPTPRTAKTQ